MDKQIKRARRRFLKGASTTTLVVGASAAALAAGQSVVRADAYNVTVDFGQWGSIYLAPGATLIWGFTWTFSPTRWTLFDASPDTPGANIKILAQEAERNTSNTEIRWITFKNVGSTGLTFRPKVVVAPRT